MGKEKGKSLLDTMKADIEKSGGASGDLFFVKAGNKRKIRFVNDFEDAKVIQYHSIWQEYNIPCLTHFGKECPKCDDSDAKNYNMYAWTIYDYEDKTRKLFLFKSNSCSPVPDMIDKFEIYDTLTDRDYVISRKGTGTNTTYSLTPMDAKKVKLKVDEFTEDEIFALVKNINKKDITDILDEIGESLDDEPKKNKKTSKSKKKEEPEVEEDDDELEDDEFEDEDDDLEDEEDEEEIDFESMKISELKEYANDNDIDISKCKAKGKTKSEKIKSLKTQLIKVVKAGD